MKYADKMICIGSSNPEVEKHFVNRIDYVNKDNPLLICQNFLCSVMYYNLKEKKWHYIPGTKPKCYETSKD